MTEQLWDITVGDLLDQVAERHGNHEAVVYTDRPYKRTYAEFRDEVNTIARSFLALGIKKDDKIAIWAANYPEWMLTMFAASKIGAVAVTVNTNYKVFELEYLLRQSDTTTLVMTGGFKDSNYVDIVNALNPDLKNHKPGEKCFDMLPELKNIVYVGDDFLGEPCPTPPGMFNWKELYALAEKVTPQELAVQQSSLNPDEVINIQYTSGTTGFPKGVMLTHYNIVNNGKGIGDCMKFTYEDRLCIPVPFFHCFGLVLAIMASLTHATTMIPVDRYSPLKVMDAVVKERCTALHGVPTMFIAILEHPRFKEFDFSRLRTGIMAGSPCPIKVMRQAVDEMNLRELTIAYGLTESSPVCCQTRTDDSLERKVGTVGRRLPFVEVKIADPETGEELPKNTPGELMIRGYSIMKGYYNMPEATAQAITEDGWLHSGDLGVEDESGYFNITGRIKDMIIRGGENIYPKEIEEFLYTHPAIKDVQVIGVPSEAYGEEVMACIVLREGESLTEDEVKSYVNSRMARHKTPRYVKFMASFPMTASGKIQKYKMRELAVDELGLAHADSIETA